MGILSGNPKEEPLHYGEVFSTWSYLLGIKGLKGSYQTLLNHIGDEDLKRFVRDAIDHVLNPEINEIENLLKVNGVGLPPSPPDKPIASFEAIPTGARFSDPEIAASIANDIRAGLISCSTIMAESIREDVGAMFAQFHMKKAQGGLNLLRMRKEKAWLIPPPLHKRAPEIAQV